MADSKTRQRRLRQRRQQAGLKAALVWLTPEAQAAMAALRQPGETVDDSFNRVLITLARSCGMASLRCSNWATSDHLDAYDGVQRGGSV